VLTANSGTQAVALYAKHREQIDVVLTDMNMPGMDGLATARALHNLDPSAQIIVMSGIAVREGDDEASTIGRFLSKPYTAESLLSTLRAVLELAPERNGRPASEELGD
jgi:two-component system, cell cycle sensor histidine kinase and response regulator CckA